MKYQIGKTEHITRTAKSKSLLKFFTVLFIATTALFGQSAYAQNDETIEVLFDTTGPYDTTSTTAPGFTIHYPTDANGALPVIAWGNGTGASPMVYSGLFQHWASWGFVVVASNSTQAGNGQPLLDAINYIEAENKKLGSPFYGRIDMKNVGTSGHSQGGGGAIAAGADPRVKTSAPLAPGLIWGVTPYNAASKLNGPTFLMAGANDTIVSPMLVRYTAFNPSNKVPTLFAVADGMDHFSFMWTGGMAKGYSTAWFMAYLQDDPLAREAFEGSCEICSNPNWTVEKKNY